MDAGQSPGERDGPQGSVGPPKCPDLGDTSQLRVRQKVLSAPPIHPLSHLFPPFIGAGGGGFQHETFNKDCSHPGPTCGPRPAWAVIPCSWPGAAGTRCHTLGGYQRQKWILQAGRPRSRCQGTVLLQKSVGEGPSWILPDSGSLRRPLAYDTSLQSAPVSPMSLLSVSVSV